MPTEQEKLAFARRLRTALNRMPDPVKGATQLALRFNLRHRAGAPVSAQTAHKWLSGRSIPTAEKIETLAAWLDVTTHWLNYGPPPSRRYDTTPTPHAQNQVAELRPPTVLLRRIEALPPHQRYLIEELVSQLGGDAVE